MKNELITLLVLIGITVIIGVFIRYFWWLILILIGIYAYRNYRFQKSLKSAQEELEKQLTENVSYGQVFAQENHDIIEAEYTEHEE